MSLQDPSAVPPPEPAAGPVEGQRRVSLLTAALGVTVFVLIAWRYVPWHPVPGGPLVPPAPEEVFTPAQIARAEDYSRWARLWSWSSLGVGLALAAGLGWSARIRRLVARSRGPWWVRAVVVVAGLNLAAALVALPFGIAFSVLRHRYGLSRQPWTGFAVDRLTGLGVGVVATALGVVLVLAIARRWPRAWPVIAGGSLGCLVLLGSFVYPLLVEPLSNSFEPLPDGPLRTQVLRLAEVEGVRVDDVLVSDASRRTTTLNAYVSGFGSTRRIVLYDNLVHGLPRDQALSVVAHELAHARHDDVLVGSVLGVAGAFAGVGLLGLVFSSGVVRRRYDGDRVAVGQVAAVPLIVALSLWGSFLAGPVQNGISRQVETRADVDALRATHDPQAFIAMQKELARRSLSDPTVPAWAQWWFGSHPTTRQRIAIAQRLGE